MRTTVGVFFGGRSVEHEISVISALQAIAALDPARYEAVPVYITKQGQWLTGPALLDTAAYRDMNALERRATEVYMRPVFGERILRRTKHGLLGGGKPIVTLDLALPVLHGTNGEDGTFQGLLELTGIPYVGCNVLSSAVGMDKIAMKMMLRESGIPVIDYVWFTDREWGGNGHGDSELRRTGYNGREEIIARIEAELGYPAIVKPANLGSSVGISRARNRDELLQAVEGAKRYSSRIIVEKMIDPLREINCSVLGSADDHRTSVCEEPMRSGEILSYADKYLSGGSGAKGGGGGKISVGVAGAKSDGGADMVSVFGSGKGSGAVSGGMSSTKRRIPADLDEHTAAEVRRLASETFRVLGCEGVARVDFILDVAGDGTPLIYVNEINTIPGSLSFYLWEATGVEFGKLMDTLVGQALKRERDKSHKTVSYEANIFDMGSLGGTKGGGKTGAGEFAGKK